MGSVPLRAFPAEHSRAMTSLRTCAECNNILYPREDPDNKRLLYACRHCDYSEIASQALVYRNDLQKSASETAGVTTDVASDPTLPRANKECPNCQHREAVFFQSQARRAETKMTLFFVCVNCGHTWED